MASDKTFLLPLIGLLLVASASGADVGLDFTLVNSPPSVDLSLAPAGPAPGNIVFNSNATYYDLEMQTGTVNLTWYVGGTLAQAGGFYPAVAPGGTVAALPFPFMASGGETIYICADVSDGTNPPVTSCRSTAVTTPSQPPSRAALKISAAGGMCAFSPIELTFQRTGSVGSFSLFVRRPGGGTETIFMEAGRDSYLYLPDAPGSYYFGAIASGNVDVTGASITVGELVPVLRMPACSFMENPADRSLSSTGQPVSVYIVDNTGVVQDGSINVSWSEAGRQQNVFQDGGAMSFVPRVHEPHLVSVEAHGCRADTDFVPNVCTGNQTINETIKYTMGNQTFYIWRMPGRLNGSWACNPFVCNMTADCCEGYCLDKKCVIPPTPLEPWIRLRSGCYGMFECTDRTCELLCDLMWVAVVALAAYAAYLRRKHREEAAMLFLVPIAVAALLFPLPGLVAGAAALAFAVYRGRLEGAKKNAKLQEKPEKSEKPGK